MIGKDQNCSTELALIENQREIILKIFSTVFFVNLFKEKIAIYYLMQGIGGWVG